MARQELLKKVSLFDRFSTDEAKALSEIVYEREFRAGGVIFGDREPATSMYVIRSGTVEILKEGKSDAKLVVATLGSGSPFGEMAFVDRAARAAAAVAKDDVSVLEIKYEDLVKLIEAYPAVGRKIYQSIAETLCGRIRRTTSDLSSLLLS